MEHIIARQNAAAKPAEGKTLLLGVAQIILELALVQAVVVFLISATGTTLLSLLFYGLAAWLFVRFLARMVSGSVYTLCGDKLVLERLMGDSTVLSVKIPLENVVSIRPYAYGQRLHLDYRRVTYVDAACAPGLRMGIAFGVSLFWAWLARVIAGKKAQREAGVVIVYMEGRKRRACAFRPDAAFSKALEAACPDAFGADERMGRGKLRGYFAMSLRRAFGELYPHAADAVTQEELAFEQEEFARRKAQKLEKTAQKRKISVEQLRREQDEKAKKRAAAKKKAAAKINVRMKAKRKAHTPDSEPMREETAAKTQDDAPRRRRGRQE